MASSDFPLYPTAIVLPVLAIITIIIDIPPLAWHIKNRNLAASSLVSWTLLSNLMNAINPFIWPTDDIESWWHGSGLCDVEVKLRVAFGFGFAGSLVCIMQNLAKVLDTKRTVLSLSRSERRRRILVECLFCLGGPIYSMAVHYIVQPNRYYVFAISGCTISYDNSWPKFALLIVWPPLLCTVAVYYSVLVILRMHRYRKDFSEVLTSSNSNLTKSRFLRLFLLAMTIIAVALPTQYYVLYRNSILPLLPYSWTAIHGPDWQMVRFVPVAGAVELDRWAQVASGFALFPFFGFGQDAKMMYRKALVKIGFGRVFPGLHRHPYGRQPQDSFTDSHAGTFMSRTRSFFHKKFSENSTMSSNTRHASTQTSVATLSPVEKQGNFHGLPFITETSHQDAERTNIPSHDVFEGHSPENTRNQRSRLDQFLVKTHLSTPLRR